MKRIVSFFMVFVVVFCAAVPSAYAAVDTGSVPQPAGSGTLDLDVTGKKTVGGTRVSVGAETIPLQNWTATASKFVRLWRGSNGGSSTWHSVRMSVANLNYHIVEGAPEVGIYFSVVPVYDPRVCPTPSFEGWADMSYEFNWYDENNRAHVDRFTAEPFSGYLESNYNALPGYTFKYSVKPTDGSRVMRILDNNIAATNPFNVSISYPLPNRDSMEFIVSSCQVITTAKPGELAELEKLTDLIIQQNQMLAQNYGSIIQLLNNIYSVLGSFEDTFAVWNNIFYHVRNKVDSIDTYCWMINKVINEFKLESHSDFVNLQNALIAKIDEYFKRQNDLGNKLEQQGIGGWNNADQGMDGAMDVFGGGTGAQDSLTSGFNSLDTFEGGAVIAQLARYLFAPFVGVAALFVLALFLIHKAGG